MEKLKFAWDVVKGLPKEIIEDHEAREELDNELFNIVIAFIPVYILCAVLHAKYGV